LRGTSRPRERPATAKQKQLLHVLPARLGWTDAERREFLVARTGKRSASDLTHREATLVLDLLFAFQRGERPATMRMDGPTKFELEKLAALREEAVTETIFASGPRRKGSREIAATLATLFSAATRAA